MKKFCPKELTRRKYRENLKRVEEEFDTPEFQKKVKAWADKFGFDFWYVMNEITANEYFQACFIKDPLRQISVKNEFADWIKTSGLVENFQKLTVQDKKKLYFRDGKITGKPEEINAPMAKLLDFKWELATEKNEVLDCYAVYRHIKGGSHQSQYEDLKELVKHAPYDEAEKKVLFIFCDGFYFDSEDRLRQLEKINKENKFCIILRSSELEERIEKLLSDFSTLTDEKH